MDKKDEKDSPKPVQALKRDKIKKVQADVVPWQNQEICIVENFEQCRALVKKLRT